MMLRAGVISFAMCPAHIAQQRERLFNTVIDGYVGLLWDYMDDE
jgi:hypothetical protein